MRRPVGFLGFTRLGLIAMIALMTVSMGFPSYAQVYRKGNMQCLKGVYGSEDCVPMDDTGTDTGSGFIYREPKVYNPVPDQARKLDKILKQVARFCPSARAYQSWGSPQTESELLGRIDSVYAAAFEDFRYVVYDVNLASRQIGWFRRELPVLQAEVARLEQWDASIRAEIAELKRQTAEKETEMQVAMARTAEISNQALAIANDFEKRDALMSYLLVFAPSDAVSQAVSVKDLTTHYDYSLWQPIAPYVEKQSLPVYAADSALPTRNWPTRENTVADPDMMPRLDPLTGSVDMRLANLANIGDTYPGLAQQRTDWQPKAAQLKAEYEQLWDRRNELHHGRLGVAIDEAKIQLDYVERLLENEQIREKAAATQFVEYAVRDYAMEIAQDHLIEKIEDLTNLSGLSDLPLSSADVIHQMAMAGHQVVLPHSQFVKEWDAFIRVQQQTLDLVTRAQGHMTEAARLAAQGTPEEMQDYLDHIFRDVKWQTVEYVKTAGMTALPDEESESFFTKTFNQYLSFRKSEEGAE